MMHSDTRQRGFALLIVLWTLALLALLGSQVLATGRQDTQLARNLRDAAVLESAASGAVQQAIFGILDGSAHHWSADGTVHTVRLGLAVVAVQIDNEADKVNPSIASPALLQALLLQVGADPVTATTVAASIVEWRLASGNASKPSATVARYESAGREYAPTGAPFVSIDELGAVLGMTPELLARLRSHVTVYTDDDPGANTRDPVVARALAAAGQLQVNANETGEELVSVTADARGPDNGRFTIHVVVRTNAKPEGRRYEILAYERLWRRQP
jgi:general secretion pathway protein K